jgi:hypothetical protein
MEWLDTDVGSAQATLEKRSEVFHPVGVNSTVNVSLGMIDDLASSEFPKDYPARNVLCRSVEHVSSSWSTENRSNRPLLAALIATLLAANIRNAGDTTIRAFLLLCH